MRRIVPALLALLAIAWAAPAFAQPPLWVLRDEDSTIYLFGSIHLLPADTPWRRPDLDAALARADDLWFELPLNPAADQAIGELSRIYGNQPRGRRLSDQLAPEDAARMSRIVDRFALYGPGLEGLRPWIAELALSLAADSRAGGSIEFGVDRALEASTPPSVTRRAFETPEEQVRSLSGASDVAQLAALARTLKDIEETPELLLTVTRLWMQGDLTGLDATALSPLRAASPEVYRRLIVDRNRRWSGQIEARLRGRGVTVMVVGAGHLIGPDSVPAMLRARGLVVEGP